MSLVFNDSDNILGAMAEVKTDMSSNEIYINETDVMQKSNGIEDIIATQEITVETVDYSKMIADDVEIAMMNELLEEKDDSDFNGASEMRSGISGFDQESGLEDTIDIQSVRFVPNMMRSRKGQIKYRIIDESEYALAGEQDIFTEREKVENDPREQMHYVKYFKRDGKTHKVWECGICRKQFRHQYTLMRHLPTHTDERNFKCKVCGKGFRQMSTLSQHQAIHSDARPYVCELCKKTFNRVSTLISHRKTHSDHKPHKCHICGKGFHQKGNLRNHVFTHTNERPYKCEICGKGFNQMSNLMCHKQKAHGLRNERSHQRAVPERYHCRFCEATLLRRCDVHAHEENAHGVRHIDASRYQVVDAVAYSQLQSTSRVQVVQQQPQIRTFPQQQSNISTPQPSSSEAASTQQQHIQSTHRPQGTPSSPRARGRSAGLALLRTATGASVVCKLLPHRSGTPLKQVVLAPVTADDIKSEGVLPAPHDSNNRWIVKADRHSRQQQVHNYNHFTLRPTLSSTCEDLTGSSRHVGVAELRAAEQQIMFQTTQADEQ